MSANIAKINLLHKEAYKKNVLKENSVCMNSHSPENVNGNNGKSILYELEYKIKNNKNKEFSTKDIKSLATSNKKNDEFKLSQKLKETLVNDIMNKSTISKRNERQESKKDNLDNIKIMNNLTYELNSIINTKDREQFPNPNPYNENSNDEINNSNVKYNKEQISNDDPTSTFYTRLLDNLHLDERQSQKYLEKMNQE